LFFSSLAWVAVDGESYAAVEGSPWTITNNKTAISKSTCESLDYWGGWDQCGKDCVLQKTFSISSGQVDRVTKIRFSGIIWPIDYWDTEG